MAYAEIPTGTVTFLFTDIEGSTQLWNRAPDTMRTALARHDTIVSSIIHSRNGFVFKTVGDAFCVAFQTPLAALETAVDVQRALYHESWPTPIPIRVRMALHTGTAEERDSDYFGPTLNRVARLLASGHGGQTLLSMVTTELVRDQLPSGISLRDLGQHQLKDLLRPEQIYQMVIPDLPAEFPPLRTVTPVRSNLPAQPTPFVGRERELAAITGLLRHPDTRLVTLIGPGGTGKTRLALQIAADRLNEYSHGVFFIDLSAVHDPDQVLSRIAETLEIKEDASTSLLSMLENCLREKHLLLVLDNFEQVMGAAPNIRNLVAAAPRLKILITSREALRIYGEHRYPVPPLELPNPREKHTVVMLSQYEAVRLFVLRARAVKPDFEITEANALAVANICARLDGLPLAIELAAARSRALSPDAIHSRLDSRLKTLIGGARDLPTRQQTLRGAIDWSYNLLDEGEKTLFERLSVFVGGWTLEDAAHVCDTDHSLPFDILGGLELLLDKSLIRSVDSVSGDPRFVMLETIREYAAERLAQGPDVATIHEEHARHFLTMVQDPQFFNAPAAYHRAAEAHDNLRAALAWALANGHAEITLQIGTALWPFWANQGHLREGRHWLAEGLALGADTPPRVRADALRAAGNLAYNMHDLDPARVYCEDALLLYRSLEDKEGIAACLNNLGNLELEVGSAFERATALYEEALGLVRELNDLRRVATYLGNIGIAYLHEGKPQQAHAALVEAVEIARAQGYAVYGWVLAYLGLANMKLGDMEQARLNLREALSRAHAYGAPAGVMEGLRFLGYLALSDGHAARAARLIGASDAISEELELRLTGLDRRAHDAAIEEMRTVLGDDTYTVERTAGRSMSLDAAVDYALAFPD